MFRLLIPCLIWLSSVRSEADMQMHMSEGVEMDKGMESEMKSKRGSFHDPCPPAYHGVSYQQPVVYIKPYMPPMYQKKEMGGQSMSNHIQYFHQASVAPVMYKPMVTYVKPAPMVHLEAMHSSMHHQPVQSVKSYMPVISQPKVIYQKQPMYSYAPVYQKPVHEPMPKAYFKKFEIPAATQIMYQKPMYKLPQQIAYSPPIHYHEPKVVHVQPTQPSIEYVKPEPMAQHQYMSHGQSFLIKSSESGGKQICP